MTVHAMVPDWLVADDEIERPVLGGLLRGDLEVWDATWEVAPSGGHGVTLVGTNERDRPVTELRGTVRAPEGYSFGGFFVDAGEVVAYVYTGPYEGEDGPVAARRQPDDGDEVTVRGTLGFAPDYVTEGTFVPLRALDAREDAETFLPTWSVRSLAQEPFGSWRVEVEAVHA